MPLDLFSEETRPQNKPLDLFAEEPEQPKRGRYDWLVHTNKEQQPIVNPTIQRLQSIESRAQSQAPLRYLEKFIKGSTFGAIEPELAPELKDVDWDKPKGFETAKKVSEFIGYGVGMAPIIKMTTAPIQGAIQSYSFLKGASPALKAAIQGTIQGGIIGATEAAAKGKPIKTGLIDTGITSLLFGLINAGPTKFFDWMSQKGVSQEEAQKVYADLVNVKQNLAKTRIGTISSNFENYIDKESRILGSEPSKLKNIQYFPEYKGANQVQKELQEVFNVIPPERTQLAQERTSELLRLAKQTIAPVKENLHRPWLNILKDLNSALGKKGAIGSTKLTKEQIMARNRLSKDITVIMRNAARTGKNIETYLTDLGYDKIIAKELQEIAQTKIETALPLGKRISDEVKQYVDAANLAMKKGKTDIAEKMASKAVKNGAIIKFADGPEVETLVNQHLNKLPNQPLPTKTKEILPKYAGSINLERQDIPRTAKEFEIKFSEEIPKSTQTWIETNKEASKIIGNQKQFQTLMKKAARGKGVTPQEIDALRQVEVNAISELAKIAESPQRESLLKEFQEGIFLSTSKAATTAGRALNIHKRITAPNQMASAFSKLKRNLTDKEWERFDEANKLFNEGNPKALFEFADYIEATKENPKIKDYIYEYWYNSILSGIPTHLVNTGSNTLWQLFQGSIHRPLLSAIEPIMSKLEGRQKEYFISEVIPIWAGMGKGFKRGAKAAKEVIKKGYTLEEGATKWDQEVSQAMGAWERSPYPIVRKMAPFITAFSRGLRAMDVWAKSIAFDGQIEALAMRKAAQQGFIGETLKRKAKEYAKAPTDLMIEDATKYADYATFMDAPGEATQKILNLRRSVPGGRLVLPFVNTIANLLKRGVEMTPGLGLTIKGGREAIKTKGPALTEVVAKQIEGVMVAAVIANLYADGRITGPTPRSSAEREAKYRVEMPPWSIKIGDQWYSYRRIEPFNTVIGSVAILMDEWNESKEEPTTEKIIGVGTGIAQNLLDGSYLQGVNGLMDAIKSGETNPQKLINIVERISAGFVPYSSFQRSLVRATEAVKTGKTTIRTPETFIDVIKSQTPGLSTEVRSRKNIWGEPIELEGGPIRQFLPWKVQTESPDPVDKEIYRLGKAGFMPFPGMPQKKIEGKTLTPEQYDTYLTFSGSSAKRALNKLIASSIYQKKSDNEKAKDIVSILRKSREGQKIIKLFLMYGPQNIQKTKPPIDLFGEE